MSWFSSSTVSTVELDNKISEATSEAIPNGEVELSIALEITDLIRSKKIPPQQCMRSLKKRLTLVYSNPNLLTSTLKLIDLCVKNSGYHFLVEISSREFIDYLVDFVFKIHYNIHDTDVKNNPAKLAVGQFILQLIASWKLAFENQLQLGYVESVYNQLINQNYQFPSLDENFKVNSKFVDSQAAPDWIDSDACMICYNAFSIINRKHHCRACGGVFCNEHSLSRIPLVSLGIMDPVRVCDNCFAKHTKNKPVGSSLPVASKQTRSVNQDDDDEELRKAIELSLQESQGFAPVASPPSRPQPQEQAVNDEDEDEAMKAAIAASLKEFEQQENIRKTFQQQENTAPPFSPPQAQAQAQPQPSQPESDFYNISIPQFQPYASDSYGQQPQAPQNQAPYQSYEAQQPQAVNPPPVQQQPPPVEDLSQQEEENINLFITLMNSVKNDRKKKANILYDSNLNELHSKVITLKPKVNKSLRLAIEKYESFLELNNKISTVSKLYDEFLESKLSMAYKNQNLHAAQSTGGPNYFQSNNQYGNYVETQTTGVNQSYTNNAQYAPNEQYVGQQSTGYQNQYDYQQSINQQSINQPNISQLTGQQILHNANQQNVNPQVTGQKNRPNSQYESEPVIEPPVTTFNGRTESYGQPEAQYPPTTDYSYNPQASYQQSSDLTPEDSDKEYLSKIPVGQGTTDNSGGSIPYPYTSSPLNSDEYSTELQQSLPSASSAVRRQSSTIPAGALEDATAKFPALENEPLYAIDESASGNFSNMDRFPQVPITIDQESISSSKSKYVAEPEPLIEL